MGVSNKKRNFAQVIELERHIEILLLSNDCVIVPNFGGFMAHHVDARYDESDHTFLPPLRTIGFNPQLKMNDSLLAQSYIEAYDISYPEAIKRIEDEVNELRQHLENDGKFELNDIGVIYLNGQHHIEFEPCEAGILTPELYGLSSFEMQPVSAIAAATEKPMTIVVESKKKQDEQRPVAVEQEAEEPLKLSSNIFVNDDDDRTVSISIGSLRNLAVACIVIIAFLLMPSPIGNGKHNTQQTSNIDTGMLYRIMPRDISLAKALPVTTAQVQATKPRAEKLDTAKNAVDASPYYSLVLASRVTRKNARAYVATLQRKGYAEAMVLPRPKGAKVIYGKYQSKKQAYRAQQKLNDNKEFADCWIMLVKPSRKANG